MYLTEGPILNSLSISPYEGERKALSLLIKEGLKGEFQRIITNP